MRPRPPERRRSRDWSVSRWAGSQLQRGPAEGNQLLENLCSKNLVWFPVRNLVWFPLRNQTSITRAETKDPRGRPGRRGAGGRGISRWQLALAAAQVHQLSGSRCSQTGQTQLANPSCSVWSHD